MRTSTGLGAIFTIAICVILASGIYFGYRLGRTDEKAAVRVSDVRDQKILDVIVRRNPQAAVKDFQNFPAQFIAEAQALDLDYRYVMALIDIESEWHPDAVSPKCAIGLMQITPIAVAEVSKTAHLPEGFTPPVRGKKQCYESLGSLAEPVWNIRIGMRYLRAQIDSYGFGPEHLRAYNRGPSLAKAHWPGDRYAENVALKFVALAGGLPQ
jgi:soluble lytic murein transglycosylase-like protein